MSRGRNTQIRNVWYGGIGPLGWITVLALFLVSAYLAAQGPVDPLLLWEQATLYRDEWGTPHVYAETPRALGFAFGYAQAEDHLEGMLKAYRVANGRAAEIGGEAYAASDEFALKLGHAELAKQALAEADPVTRDLCEGFSLGVNAWMIEHRDRVPPWADGTRPEDPLALLHCYLMSMAPFDLPETYRLPTAAESGNALAIGPQQSTTGEPVLVINPHTYYDGPFQWYEAHLVCQDLNVAGVTLFGLPVLVQGHNEVLGWALTPNSPDFADMYMEPGFGMPRAPNVVGGPRFSEQQMSLLAEFISGVKTYFVRTQAGHVQRQVERLTLSHGPVMGSYQGRFCSYHVGGYGEFGTLRQLVEMARARDLDGFKAALGMQQLPCFHVVYADRDGNIFYLYNAKVGDKFSSLPSQVQSIGGPVGEEPVNWERPVPAEDPRYAWGRIIPIDKLPSVTNPAAGYIQACGCPPWRVTDDSEIREEDWPPWFVRDRDTYRARRARQLLGMGPRSFYESQSVLYDVLAPFAMEAVPKLLEAAEQYPKFVANAHPDLPLGLRILDQWNYAAEVDSAGMTFFHVWFASLQGLVAPQIQSPAALMETLVEHAPQMQELSLQAASQASKLMRNGFDSLTVPWGDAHRIRRGEREEPLAGALTGEPLFVASDRGFIDGVWQVTYGYAYAMVVRFGQEVEAVSMVPFGASEDPDSPHYDDQLDLLVQRRFKLTRFKESAVQRHAESGYGRVITLRPVGVQGTVTLRAESPVKGRMKVSATPPIAPPYGLAPYTVYIKPEIMTPDVPVVVDMTISIPVERCTLEDLQRLVVCAYDGNQGWVVLETQELDAETRTFTARDRQARLYAVLGPPQPAETAGPPHVPRVSEVEEQEAVDIGAEPPKPAPEQPREVPLIAAVPAPEPARPIPGASKRVFIVHGDRERAGAPRGAAAAPQVHEEAAPETGERPPKRVFIVHDRDESARQDDQSKGDAEAPGPLILDKSMVKAMGSFVRGTVLDLRPPGVDALFHLGADVPIRARLLVLEELPVRLPTGMAAFSPYVAPQWIPGNRTAEVGISWHVAPGVRGKEGFEQLALYAYDVRQGWLRLPDQKVNVETGRLTAICDLASVYVVLGPADPKK